LWDFETNSKNTFEYIFKDNNIGIEIEDFNLCYKPINQKYWKLFREDKVSKEELRYARLKETFDVLDYAVDDELINVLAEKYIENLSNYNKLFNGAIDILDYLKPKYNMHIITNGFDEVQHRKLKNSLILPYFNHIVSSEKVGVKKPNPKIFQYALEIASATSKESIMIGDNFEADILGARSVGMHTIFCNFDKESVSDGERSISKLGQLKNHL
jgi:putative hydrolase of the HAD superfamily